jgi:hypothetical protein
MTAPADEGARWRPIDSCPENTPVLFWCYGRQRIGRVERAVERMDGSKRDLFSGEGGFHDEWPPTMWHELPAPPQSGESE